jgi:hypothetical protein
MFTARIMKEVVDDNHRQEKTLPLRRPLASVFCVLAFLLSACELIVIKNATPKQAVIPTDQTSPQGVVLVFKSEIENANVQGALKLMASEDERPLLAIERRELYEEIARLGRMMAKKDITRVRADTLSPIRQRLRAEFGYLREFTFTTVMIDSVWYISRIAE